MASYSWVKLYIEILDDPKMGRMTDDLWRRTIEVILMAGRVGNSGALPQLEDMAWTLRISREQLESDLMKLAQVNVVRFEEGTWHVVNFERRQAAIDVKDRVAQYRNRIKKHDYYEDDTEEKQAGNESVTNRYTDTDKEEDTDKDKNRSDHPVGQGNLNELQKTVLITFNAKRFKNGTQAALVSAWDRYPPENVKAACTWAATKGFGLGQAIASIDKALPKWSAPKQNGNGRTTHAADGDTSSPMMRAILKAQKDPNYGKQ